MKLIKQGVHDFNLTATLESGQLFRYRRGSGGSYVVVVGDSILELKHEGNQLSCNSSNSDFEIAKFLGLRQSYADIIGSIRKDEKISAAIKNHHGLRILEQDPWECAASFIISSFSNIPRIKQCIEKVSATFGSIIEFGTFRTFSFPQPQQINSFSKLKKCGLGYRAKYLFDAARMFGGNSDDYSLRQIRKLDYAAAKKKVMELPGVGEKVADCTLLFAYRFYEAFPVDVWVNRAMLGSYRNEMGKFAAARKRKISESVVAEFARSYFGEYAGYAQQFLYHDVRTSRNQRAAPAPLP